MKNIRKLSALGLAASLAFIGTSQAFADTSSPFYKNKNYRQEYVKLSKDQQEELDKMNTDGRVPIKIDELRAYGKYQLPIVKGKDWLYPFMHDKDGDGMVGENYSENNGSTTTTTVNKTETIIEKTYEKIVPLVPTIPSIEITNTQVIDNEVNHIEEEHILKITSELDAPSTEIKEEAQNEVFVELKEARDRAQKEVNIAENLMINFPKTVANVREKLEKMLKDAKETIRLANELLEEIK